MEGQNNVVEPKKKSSIGVIILVIILMIGCLVGGYFLNESGILSGKKDTTKEDKKEPVVTNYEVTDSKVAKLIDNLTSGGFDCQVLKTYVNDHKVTVDDISSDRAFRIAEKEIFNSLEESYTLDEISNIVKKYLGKDYKFNPKDNMGKGECYSYYYDSTNKEFKKQETACGGTCGPMTSYKLVKAVDTDGELVLNAKVIFVTYDSENDGYYSDYNMTNRIGSYEDDLDSLFTKGSDYKFTFKLEDGNYVFVSSEPAK